MRPGNQKSRGPIFHFSKKWGQLSPAVPLAIALAALGIFPWSAMALRWPLRILAVAGFAAAILLTIRSIRAAPTHLRLRRALLAVGCSAGIVVFLWLLHPAWENRTWKNDGKTIPDASRSVARALELRQELDDRGIDFAVLGVPFFDNVQPDGRMRKGIPAKRINREGRRALAKMERAGLATVDLLPLFETCAPDASDWLNDGTHLQEENYPPLTAMLEDELRRNGIITDAAGEARHTVLMGNCYAGIFGRGLRDSDPKWRGIRHLTAQADQGRVADFLFLFPEEYLEDTRRVIWLMTYDVLAIVNFPPLETAPDIENGTVKDVILETTAALAWNKRNAKDRLKSMPYPDALVAIGATVLEGSDLPAGSEVVGLGHGIRDRQLLSLGRLRTAKKIRAHLIPLNAYLKQNPKLASLSVVNQSPDLDVERYWIRDWTFLP